MGKGKKAGFSLKKLTEDWLKIAGYSNRVARIRHKTKLSTKHINEK